MDVVVLMRRDRFCSAAGTVGLPRLHPIRHHVARCRRIRVVPSRERSSIGDQRDARRPDSTGGIRTRAPSARVQPEPQTGRVRRRPPLTQPRATVAAPSRPTLHDRKEQILRTRIGRRDLECRQRFVLGIRRIPQLQVGIGQVAPGTYRIRGPLASAARNHRAATAASPAISASRPRAEDEAESNGSSSAIR